MWDQAPDGRRVTLPGSPPVGLGALPTACFRNACITLSVVASPFRCVKLDFAIAWPYGLGMTLQQWLQDKPRGTITRLMRDSGVSTNTVSKAARGLPVTYETAERLSEATGGEVSIESLRFPDGRPQ